MDCDDLIITVHVQESDSTNGVFIQTDIARKTDSDNNEYISRPVLLAEWDKPATVSIGTKVHDKYEDELTLVVKASQAS